MYFISFVDAVGTHCPRELTVSVDTVFVSPSQGKMTPKDGSCIERYEAFFYI